MIFTKQHAEMILRGEKTQTIRRCDKQCPKLGQRVAVQPGRGKKAIGYITILSKEFIDPYDLYQLTVEQVRADGFESLDDLIDTLSKLHRCDPHEWGWNRLTFKVTE